jgi:hypothetical protein
MSIDRFKDQIEKFFSRELAERLSNEIHDLNGELFYHSISATAGWLPESEFLVVRQSTALAQSVETVDKVGSLHFMDSDDFMITMALNYDKLAHLENTVRIKVAYFRSMLVTKGIFNSSGKAFNVTHDEIEFAVSPPSDLSCELCSNYIADKTKEIEREAIAELVVLAPAMASIQFIKTNHHYLDNSDYRAAYDRHFRSSVKEHLKNVIPYNYLFHTAIHWMGPNAMFHYSLTMKEVNALPDGILLKLNAAPAGCALITTSAAVLRTMSILPFYVDMEEAHGSKLTKIKTSATEILKDPLKYHLHAELFGLPKVRDTVIFHEAYEAAKAVSPFTQAFLDVFGKDSPLGEARAIAKHADENFAVKSLFAAALRRFMAEQRRTSTVRSVLTLEAPRELPTRDVMSDT